MLDSPACQEGLSWQISPGDTIRAAKEKCHLSHHLAQKQLDLQLVDLHRNKLKEHVKRANFVQRCSEFFQNCEAPAQTSCSILDIDDDDTDNVVTHELGMTELQFQSTVVSLYKKIVDGEAAKVLLDKASGDKKQEQKKKFLEQVANKSPEDFLKETIDERLKLLTSKKGAESSGKGTSSAELAVAAIQSHTGKISPDQAQQIPANTPLQKPAPKANPKPMPKSKGKGVTSGGKGAGGKGQKGKSKSKGAGKPVAPKKQVKNELSPPRQGGCKVQREGRWW